MPSTSTTARARRLLALLPVALLALTGCTFTLLPEVSPPTAPPAELVSEAPCDDADGFTCITLAVPRDHFAADSGTMNVTFALRRGDVDSRGVFVTATGGPGSAGIYSAESYTDAMPAEITDHFDVVFFDQRGIGQSGHFSCDGAFADDDTAGVDPSSDDTARDSFAAGESRFASACFAEAGVPESDARLYGTRQAVEDLEDFRVWLGADQLTLYGESYGTQYQQTYAAAHPDHVAGLILDGVVDLSTDAIPFYVGAAQAYSDTLSATLTACDAERSCRDDAPGDSAAGYDRLAQQLTDSPTQLPGGQEFTADDLRYAASGSVSEPYGRELFQEALNAGLAGDFSELADLAAPGGSDPSFSDALYYAVECQDYDFVPAGSTGRDQLDVWLDAAANAGVPDERLGDIFYGDLTCLFWPGDPDFARPAPVLDPPYPLLVLTADTDPNTPVSNALRVFSRTADDAAMVLLEGGPHVIYGRGDACVDDPVNNFVAQGVLPPETVTICPGQVAETYVPN